MTVRNYFLVSIYLRFNFLINPTYSRKVDSSAAVFLVLLSQMQAVMSRSGWWRQCSRRGGSAVF